jgi:hypothetical protein
VQIGVEEAVAVDHADALVVVEVSDPTHPTAVGMLSDSTYMNGAWGLAIQGKYAYVPAPNSNGLAVVEVAGFDLPSANIGDLSASTLDVTENASIANNLYVGNGLNVGAGGVYSTGPLSAYVNSTATALTVTQSGSGDLMDILDAGVSIFKVGQATIDLTRPLDLQVEGDTGLEYNLNFLNSSTSYINSAGPLTITAGDSNSYENLTLTTSGTGDVIVDIASSQLGFKVLGAAGQVLGIDPNGNVTVQGGSLVLNGLTTPTGVAVAPAGTPGGTTYGSASPPSTALAAPIPWLRPR